MHARLDDLMPRNLSIARMNTSTFDVTPQDIGIGSIHGLTALYSATQADSSVKATLNELS